MGQGWGFDAPNLDKCFLIPIHYMLATNRVLGSPLYKPERPLAVGEDEEVEKVDV